MDSSLGEIELNTVAGHEASPMPEGLGSAPKRFLRSVVPVSWRYQGRRWLTRASSPLATKRFRRYEKLSGLTLNIGCGEQRKPNCLNVDLIGLDADIAWDVTSRLPLPDRSAQGIFHEHLLEHLTLSRAKAFLKECHRLLAVGGHLRIAVPDGELFLRSYAENDGFIERVRPGRQSPMLALGEIFYGYGHQAMYDYETLSFFLKEAGFKEIQKLSYANGNLGRLDSPDRALESLYVEATKLD